MFNFPDEKYTGKPIIHSNGSWEGPGYYGCPRDFPGQETYTWKKYGPVNMGHNDIDYWGRQVGTLRLFTTKEEFIKATTPAN